MPVTMMRTWGGKQVTGGVMLIDDADPIQVRAEWANHLLALGARLARRSPSLGSDTRLVVALTVPTRDLAAVLIGTGWALTRPIKIPAPPAEVLSTLVSGTPVLLLTEGHYLFAETFYGSRTRDGQILVHVGAPSYRLEQIKYLVPGPPLDGHDGKMKVPIPGSLVTSAGRETQWEAEQVSSASDVVFVGTKSWITDEMKIKIGHERSSLNSFAELLRPNDGSRPSWGSSILPAVRSEEAIVPSEASLAILDGTTAASWINELSCAVTVAIIDRSSADDFAAEPILQVRRIGGTPVSLQDLGWKPPSGIEALAFETWR